MGKSWFVHLRDKAEIFIKMEIYIMLMGRCILIPVIVCILFVTFANSSDLLLFTDEEAERLSLSEDEWLEELNYSANSPIPDEDNWVDQLEEVSPETVETEEQTPEFLQKKLEPLTGPQIMIKAPTISGDRYLSEVPIRLLVYFKSNQYPIDIDTLKVNGRRGILTLNITGRIKKFLRSPQGGENAEFVIDGVIPKMRSGKYQIVLSLADIQGNRGVYSALLEVL